MIHRALKLTRQFHRMQQRELADRLGISKSFLSEIESNKKAPTLDLLEKYAVEFKIPASSFLIFSEQLSSKTSERKRASEKMLRLLEWIASEEDDEDAAA